MYRYLHMCTSVRKIQWYHSEMQRNPSVAASSPTSHWSQGSLPLPPKCLIHLSVPLSSQPISTSDIQHISVPFSFLLHLLLSSQSFTAQVIHYTRLQRTLSKIKIWLGHICFLIYRGKTKRLAGTFWLYYFPCFWSHFPRQVCRVFLLKSWWKAMSVCIDNLLASLGNHERGVMEVNLWLETPLSLSLEQSWDKDPDLLLPGGPFLEPI